jgi:hypothetical protein
MAKFFIDEQDAGWFPLDLYPFNGDVRVKVKPGTEDNLDVVRKKAKENADFVAGKITEQEAYAREWADYMVDDWSGVEDGEGDSPCTREKKLKSIRHGSTFTNGVMAKSSYHAMVKYEGEQKNS